MSASPGKRPPTATEPVNEGVAPLWSRSKARGPNHFPEGRGNVAGLESAQREMRTAKLVPEPCGGY